MTQTTSCTASKGHKHERETQKIHRLTSGSRRAQTRRTKMKEPETAKRVNIIKIQIRPTSLAAMLVIFLVPFQSDCYQIGLSPPAPLVELNQQADFGLSTLHLPGNFAQADTSYANQFDWAKRLTSAAGHEDNGNLISDNDNHLINFLPQQQQQQQQQQPVRPTMLKNLINSTLESIVSHQKQLLQDNQQPRLLAAARDLIRTQVINQHQQQAGLGTRFIPASSVGTRLMGFLFPQSNQQVLSVANNQQQNLLRSSNGGQPAELAASSTNLHDQYEHGNLTGRGGGNKPPALISLSAPYEQRPRTSGLKKGARSVHLLPSASTQTGVSSHHKWSPDGESLEANQDEPQQSTGNESVPVEAEQQQQQQQQESSPNQEFQWNASSPIELESSEEKTPNDSQPQNESQTEPVQQMLTAMSGGEEDPHQQQVVEGPEMTNEDNSSSSSSEEQPRDQQQFVHLNESAAHDFMANRLNNMTVAMLEPSVDPDNYDNITGNYNQLAGPVEATPELAVQLPSQYDSIIRMPPEGHYDDYFKPIGGGLHGDTDDNRASNRSILLNQSLQDYPLSFVSNAHAHNNSLEDTNDVIDDQPSQQHLTNSTADFTLEQNMKPLRQASVTFGDRNEQFPTPNAWLGGNNLTQRHRRPSGSEQNAHHYSQQQQQVSSTNEQQDEHSQPDSSTVMWNNKTQPLRLQSKAQPEQQSNQTSLNEDNIQFIVANSMANQRDPSSNEKLINYTSEGRNYTKAGGQKAARNTFVNKDLNELPPSDDYGASNETSTAPGDNLSSLMKLIRGTNSTAIQQNQQEAGQEQPAENQEATNDDTDNNDETNANTTRELLRSGQAEFGGRTSRARRPKLSYELPSSIDRDSGGHQLSSQAHRSTRHQRNEPTGGGKSRTPTGKHHNHSMSTAGSSKHSSRHQHQQTVRRPQVTEAQFNPRDLPMSPPTPMPSVTESTVNAIVDLPSKVKRLKQQPPDKNELMSELLTALDRVKTAIYKLQPLTAKMNAMYRKSITSNTRDIIMDHHKGTYSKRYPPGDFDDSYDKMHPSEMFDRQRMSSRSSGQRTRRTNGTSSGGSDEMQAGGSHANAVYLPAPREILEKFSKRSGLEAEPERETTGEQQMAIVAMGVGRRIGDGSIRGKLSLSSASGGRIVYDDGQGEDEQEFYELEDKQEAQQATHNIIRRNTSDQNASRPLEDEDVQSPLFGYRITIFQSPEGSESSPGEVVADTLMDYNNGSLLDGQSSGLSYSLIGNNSNTDVAIDNNSNGDDDSMATSESSLALSSSPGQPSNGTANDKYDLIEGASEQDDDELLDSDESHSHGGKKKKKKNEEAMKEAKKKEAHEKHKKHKKAKGEKKGEKSSKHHSKGKKGYEEHKKKKEFKKIKHNKGVMSKESHKLHRDKHVKAHDRGAAKEKALKERTQIEFFEREQIVDDEFEKGKKSTVKAGWASGHDAKKTKKETHGADSMSMGGSHLVQHMDLGGQPSTPIMVASESGGYGHGDGGHSAHEKGHGESMESSSGKQSNKFIKKKMEAKGKKFKGWREKGYKIITETEFIDRGSLHDSAYKKRDKGAAHHQKFKKHEASSEGHHGSMHELHKKSHKKEEKKKEMKEKKKENMDKKEEEAKKKGKKEAEKKKKHKNSSMEKKYKKEHDHEQEASALTMSSVDPDIDSGLPVTANATGGQSYQLRLPEFQRPASAMSASASTLRPQVMLMAPFGATKSSERPETLSRLMHVDHHDDHRKLPSFGLHEISPNNNNHNDTSSLMYHIEKAGDQNDSEIRRRSDDVTTVRSTSPSSTTTTTAKPSNLTTTTSSQPASNSTDSNPAKLANMDDKKQAKQQVQEGQIKLLTNLIKLAKARQEQPPAMVPPLKSEYHDKYQSLESPRTSLEANQPRLVFASPRQLMQEFNRPNLFELSSNNNINPSNYQASSLPEIGLPTNAIQLHQQQQQQNLPIFSSSPFAVNPNAPIGQAFLGDSNQFSQQQPLLDQFNINRFEFESDSPIMHAITPHQHQTIPSTAYQAAINNYLGVNWIKR